MPGLDLRFKLGDLTVELCGFTNGFGISRVVFVGLDQ